MMSINTTFFDFSRWRPFLKFEISTACPVRRAIIHHHAKYCADRSNRCRDVAIFGFFKMAAAAIVDFLNFKFLQSQRSRRSNCVIVPNHTPRLLVGIASARVSDQSSVHFGVKLGNLIV